MSAQVWEHPSTERPVLEPLFAAGFHGIELCLLLLAEFVSDRRKWVRAGSGQENITSSGTQEAGRSGRAAAVGVWAARCLARVTLPWFTQLPSHLPACAGMWPSDLG